MGDERTTITLLDTSIRKNLQHALYRLVGLDRALEVWRICSEFRTHGHHAFESFFIAWIYH